MSVRASLHMHREENQLDATECFIALMICSTCFGHFYAHHQEFETICVLLPPMVCDALVAGCWKSDARQQAVSLGRWQSCSITLPELTVCCPASDPRQPVTKHCTPQAVITHIQGVPGGKDLTSRECSLGQTIPI